MAGRACPELQIERVRVRVYVGPGEPVWAVGSFRSGVWWVGHRARLQGWEETATGALGGRRCRHRLRAWGGGESASVPLAVRGGGTVIVSGALFSSRGLVRPPLWAGLAHAVGRSGCHPGGCHRGSSCVGPGGPQLPWALAPGPRGPARPGAGSIPTGEARRAQACGLAAWCGLRVCRAGRQGAPTQPGEGDPLLPLPPPFLLSA